MLQRTLFAVAIYAAACETGIANPEQDRFEREGGKQTPATIIARGDELTTKDVAETRDLNGYDHGGFYYCQHAGSQNEECDLSAARQFIWSHWKARRRGYIRVGFGGKDYFSTAHVFIELDEHGQWSIRWRHVGAAALPGPKSKTDTIRDMPKITRVRQIKRSKTDHRGGDFALEFKTATGYQVGRL
jgi:hypothetical protein